MCRRANLGDQIEPSAFTEDADIRVISPTRTIDDRYANGYGNSKWAGEVLLREANDLCGLPVAVFRCDMILADPTYVGQLNVSDIATRMTLSLVATGIAPYSFYQLDADGNRQRAHFDGLPVGFVAEAIATLGAQVVDGFETYHVMNPHDDGIGLDEYVDWLIEAGYPIQRIGDFGEWLQRFETGLRALPDRQRQHSALQVMLSLAVPVFYGPQSRTAGPSRRPIDSVLRCKKRKSAPTTTSRTSRRRSSSNTSPTCNCSDCSSPLEELQRAPAQVRRPASASRACGLPGAKCVIRLQLPHGCACRHSLSAFTKIPYPGGGRVVAGVVLAGRRVLPSREVMGARMARRTFTVIDVAEVLVHWHAGRSLDEIAESLGVDRKTVRKYVAPAIEAGLSPGGPARSAAVWAELVRAWAECHVEVFAFLRGCPEAFGAR